MGKALAWPDSRLAPASKPSLTRPPQPSGATAVRRSHAGGSGALPTPTARSRRSASRPGPSSRRRTRTRRPPLRSTAARTPHGSGPSAARTLGPLSDGAEVLRRGLADRPRAGVRHGALHDPTRHRDEVEQLPHERPQPEPGADDAEQLRDARAVDLLPVRERDP